jgi:hypothetical protein
MPVQSVVHVLVRSEQLCFVACALLQEGSNSSMELVVCTSALLHGIYY